jgi:hypothetical protein
MPLPESGSYKVCGAWYVGGVLVWVTIVTFRDGDKPGKGEGELYITVFFGPRSAERAKEFADWQNGLLK